MYLLSKVLSDALKETFIFVFQIIFIKLITFTLKVIISTIIMEG